MVMAIWFNHDSHAQPGAGESRRTRIASSSAIRKQQIKEEAEAAIRKAARKHSVPEDWLVSICKVESLLDSQAYNFTDGSGRSDHAFGACQVLNSTAKWAGYNDAGCKRDFRKRSKRPRNAKNCTLFDPRVNADVAAKVLKLHMKRYKHLPHAIASYNSGSVKYCGKSGWVYGSKGQRLYSCKPGGLLNQKYVNKVKKEYTLIQWAKRVKKAKAIAHNNDGES